MASDTRLARAQQKYLLARWALLKLVEKSCPGVHDIRQHRDGLPAWCASCRRDRLGRTVETLKARKEQDQAREAREARRAGKAVENVQGL